jgi:hypothetical protein
MEILCIDGAHYQLKYFNEVAKKVFGARGKAVKKSRNPKIVVYSYWGDRHKQYSGKKRLLVCFSGEPRCCAKFSYHLLLDTKDVKVKRAKRGKFIYLPFFAVSFWERRLHKPLDLLKCAGPIPLKSEFCAFMYAHPVGFRNALFDKVSEYNQVSAIGKCRNNVPEAKQDRKLYTSKQTFYDTAVIKYVSFKFVICCENSKVPGYITEKIINARLARAVPIYLGAPDVTKYINPKAFVHAADPDFLDQIKVLHEDPVKFNQMLQQPFFVGNKLPAYFDPAYVAKRFKVLIGSL